MKKSVLFLCLFVFCFSVFQAAAREAEYTITETELIQLEKISGNWEKNRAKLQSQVSALKTLSESLNAQLKTERETVKTLRQSYAAYEKETAEAIAEKEAEIKKLGKEKEALKEKNHTLSKRVVILSSILTIIAVSAAAWIFIKLKTGF